MPPAKLPPTAAAPTPTGAPLDHVTGYLVNRLADRFRDATQARVRDARIQPRQIGMLLVLRELGPQQQQVLGAHVGMDRTTAMHFVSALAEAGIVDRQRDPNDGRAYRVCLTPAGRKLADHVARDVARAQAEVLSCLSAGEQRTFNTLLRKLLAPAAETPTRRSDA